MIDFVEKLREQLQFIARSAEAAVKVEPREGLRIATAIRVAAHQTSQSTSILTHLNVPNPEMLSTATVLGPNVMFGESGMTLMMHDGQKTGIVPALDRLPIKHHVSLSEWWDGTVYVVSGLSLTRRQLILDAANKDGGAHVDVSLPDRYEALKNGLWTGPDGRKLENQAMMTLVQIGFEFNHSPGILRIVGNEQYAL